MNKLYEQTMLAMLRTFDTVSEQMESTEIDGWMNGRGYDGDAMVKAVSMFARTIDPGVVANIMIGIQIGIELRQ